MQAQVKQEGDVVVVELLGRVDVETAEPFRDACLNKLKNQKVVFDFKNLGFVGSSGILPFIETLQKFHEGNVELLKFSGMGPEFGKVFAATPLNTVKIYETPALAALSYTNPNIQAVEAVPLIDVSTSAPRGYLNFGSPKEETAGAGFLEEDDLD